MKIIALADLHGNLPKDLLPKCDILIIAGDICPHFDRRPGTDKDIAGQLYWLETTFQDWLVKQPVKKVLAIWGNHDWVGERHTPQLPWILLQEDELILDGLRIFGTPYTPTFYNWAFMEDEDKLEQRFKHIPEGLDILISHGPPRWCCDRSFGSNSPHVGSNALYNRLRTMENPPKDLICGHIHGGRGWGRLEQKVNIWNVAGVDERYVPYKPMWTEVILETDELQTSETGRL
jgi:Icc-related predicted phosphoesterase